MAKKRRVFLEPTPLGYRVLLTRDRWREIVKFKHPAMSGHDREVRECVRDPELVRASDKDADVHLFYRRAPAGFCCVVVGRELPAGRFVITAYFTRKLKEGTTLWTK